jgi:hypothetical protein
MDSNRLPQIARVLSIPSCLRKYSAALLLDIENRLRTGKKGFRLDGVG